MTRAEQTEASAEEENIEEETRQVIEHFSRKRNNLIPILQKVQSKLGYLPRQAMTEIAKYLDIPDIDVPTEVAFSEDETVKEFTIWDCAVRSQDPCVTDLDTAFDNLDWDWTPLTHFSIDVADEPDCGAVAPLDDEALMEYFGTTTPTRETAERNDDFFEDIERGQGVYVVLYRDGKPDELFFAGFSFD